MYFCSLSSQNLLDVSFFFGFSGSLGDGCRRIHKTLILLLVVLSDIKLALFYNFKHFHVFLFLNIIVDMVLAWTLFFTSLC